MSPPALVFVNQGMVVTPNLENTHVIATKMLTFEHLQNNGVFDENKSDTTRQSLCENVKQALLKTNENMGGNIFDVEAIEKLCEFACTRLQDKTWFRKVIMVLIKEKINPLNCTEEDISRLLKTALEEVDWAIKAETFKRRISHWRGAFKLIGREHGTGVGEHIKFPMSNRILGYSGNPVSNTVNKTLLKELRARHKTPEGRIAHVKMASERGRDPDYEKVSYPVSIVVLLHVMMSYLSEVVQQFDRWRDPNDRGINDTKPLENLANLVLMLSMSLHEPGRLQAELQKELKHNDLWVLCHRPVPWLVFVFLHPKTRSFLMQSGKITHAVYGFAKGKIMKGTTIKPRIKAIVPLEYNTLDPFWWYVTINQMLFSMNPGGYGTMVFKSNLNLSSLQARKIGSSGLKHFNTYSMRYGAAKEDKDLGIPHTWIEARFGHVDGSKMKESYAKCTEANKRVGNGLLGTEIDGDDSDNNGNRGIEMDEMEFVRCSGFESLRCDRDWLDVVFKDKPNMRRNFEETLADVESWLKDCKDNEKTLTIMSRLPVQDAFKEMCLGVGYVFPKQMVPNELEIKWDENVDGLSDVFTVIKPDMLETMNELVIRYFAQTMYGKWGQKNTKRLIAKPTTEKEKEKDTVNRMELDDTDYRLEREQVRKIRIGSCVMILAAYDSTNCQSTLYWGEFNTVNPKEGKYVNIIRVNEWDSERCVLKGYALLVKDKSPKNRPWNGKLEEKRQKKERDYVTVENVLESVLYVWEDGNVRDTNEARLVIKSILE